MLIRRTEAKLALVVQFPGRVADGMETQSQCCADAVLSIDAANEYFI